MAKFLPIRENVYTSNSVTIGFAPLTSYIWTDERYVIHLKREKAVRGAETSAHNPKVARVGSHIITKVAGLQGAHVSLGTQPPWGPCWVFQRVHRVQTCPYLVGPVGLEPTTKGL